MNRHIKSVETILSKKDDETIFEEETTIDDEIYMITNNRAEWLKDAVESSETPSSFGKFDLYDAQELSKKFNKFMLAPVGKDGTKTITASTLRFKNIEEAVDYFTGDDYLFSVLTDPENDEIIVRVGLSK